MSKDAYYFKHDANAQGDLKIKALRGKFGWQGYGWFWFLIETLRNEEDFKLEYSQFTFEGLATDMGCSVDKVKEFIDYCETAKLFSKDDTYFYSSRLLRDMETLERVREQRRIAGTHSAKSRLKDNNTPTAVEHPLNECSTIKGEGRGGEENRVKKSRVNIILPEFIDKETWESFLEMRTKKRAAPTDKAVKLLLNKLSKLKEQGSNPNDVLEQSIMNGWTGIFSLKDGGNGAHPQDARHDGGRSLITAKLRAIKRD